MPPCLASAIWDGVQPPVLLFHGDGQESGKMCFEEQDMKINFCGGYKSLFSSTLRGASAVYLWDCSVQIVYSVLRVLYIHH